MLLTITTTRRPATDLGYLLAKNIVSGTRGPSISLESEPVDPRL